MISFNLKKSRARPKSSTDNNSNAETHQTEAVMVSEISNNSAKRAKVVQWVPKRQSLWQAIKHLPDPPTLEDYKQVSIDQFGKRLEELLADDDK